jgi:CheY-like chemotaxis protein
MIVRTFIAMHGGTVTASSAGIGRGSEFTIELPLSTRPIAPRARAARTTGLDPTVAPARRKVLVVDDNSETAELMAEHLVAIGHDVRIALDGPSALAIIDQFVPEVVLLDIGLPVMDGYELASRLRVALAPRELRIIAITGYGQAADHRRSRDAGFALHLVKPVDKATLRASVLER